MNRPARKPLVNGRATRIPVSHAKIEPETEVEADGETTDPDTPAVSAPVDALSELMTSLQGSSSARINVYRIVKNQPPSYVFECSPESFSLDELRDKYNGGEFRLYVMKDGRLWKNTRVIVEPRQIISAGHDPSPPTQLFDMMALIRDGFSAQTAAMREIATGRVGAPSMFSGMDLPAVITAAAAAITALRPPPAPPPAAPPDTTSQALDMFMRGMEIAMNVRDNASPVDNSIGGMLRDVLKSPIVAAAVQAQMAPQPPAQPNPRQQPAPALSPPVQPQVSHAKTDSPPPAPDAMLSYYISFLAQKAAAGADPELYAEMVLDNLTDDQLNPMLARGDLLIDDFIALHASVANHRDWFLALIKCVRTAMEATDEPENLPESTNAVNTTPPVVLGDATQ